MDERTLLELLARVRSGEATIEAAARSLTALPFQDVGVAKIDHHRALRQGHPEVIFGERKTADEIITISQTLVASGQNVLVTRLDPAKAALVQEKLPGMVYNARANAAQLVVKEVPKRDCAPVAIVTAGTSDLGVAEEAAMTLDALGLGVTRHFDVGVAGIHRLFHGLDDLMRASVVIAIAGMEGALASVVGGIVSCPVVAVPTSVGYGTALGGFTALFAMLTSCASGVAVVNIDSGFGAAMVAHRILSKAPKERDLEASRPA